MKKSLILALVAVFATCAARASVVTSEEARAVAVAWSERNAAFGVSAADVGTPTHFADANGVTLWYWVQMGTSCLVVAPVTEIEPVIAALENVDATNGLPSGHPMLAMLTRDMTDRLKKLGLYQPQAPSGGAMLQGATPMTVATPEDPEFAAAWAKEGEARWARLLPKGGARLMAAPKEEGVTEIAVQIGIVDGFEKNGRFTHWNQGTGGGGYCYNYHTPNHAVCGCVATSMGAMMQFFEVAGCPADTNCPPGLIRETQDGIRGATYNGGGVGAYTTLGGDYDWSLFSENQNRASYNTLSDAQRELLGRVAYDCGVAVAMQWTSGESGAYVLDVAAALRDVFGFKDARAVNKPTEEQYAKLIYHQCWAGAPVQLGISKTDGQGGHSVLAVGYGTDDGGIPRVRVFTGWGGSGDGWYALPYITTASIPGGSSHNFDVVDELVTMIGYEDDNVVPVCGRIIPAVNTQNATVECCDVTADVNEKGYFGLRISAVEAAGAKPVVANVGGVEKSASVMLGTEPSPKSSYEYKAAELCNWIPDDILITLLKSETASTFAEAKEKALASIDAGNPKPILAFSGTWGEAATDAAWALLQSYDDGNVDDFTNKYVVLCMPYSLSPGTASDGNPSIAVFDPRSLSVEPDKIWSFYNGRLAYWSIGGAVYTDDAALAESAATNVVENGSVTTYITGEEITNAVRAVIGTGNGMLLTGVSGITLDVLGYNVAGYGGEPGAVEPAYGLHENEIPNGTTVVATAPYAATNATTNVEFKCVGWLLTSTNSEEVLSGTGTTARFSPVANGAYTLVWLWEPNAVKITVMVLPEYALDGGKYGLVSPGTGWFKFGSEVAFTAVPGEPELTTYYHFDGWVFGDVDQLQDDDDYEETSNRLTFTVVRPVTVKARFRKASGPQDLPYDPVAPEPPDPLIPPDQPDQPEPDPSVTNVFDIVWNDGLNNLSSGYTTNLLTAAQLLASGWTVNDLTVTAPTGWVANVTQTRNGDVVATLARDDAALSAAMENCALTVYPNDDDTLTVEATIANGLRGFWYVLYGSDDLTTWEAVASGTYESGTPAAQAQGSAKNPVSEVSLSITVTPGDSAAGTKRFYKVVSGATSDPLAE